MRRITRNLACAALLAASVDAFYLPGAAPHDYRADERVELYVNALTPMIASADNAKLVSEATQPLIDPILIK